MEQIEAIIWVCNEVLVQVDDNKQKGSRQKQDQAGAWSWGCYWEA